MQGQEDVGGGVFVNVYNSYCLYLAASELLHEERGWISKQRDLSRNYRRLHAASSKESQEAWNKMTG